MSYTKGEWNLTGKDANGAVNIFTDTEYIATVRHEYDAHLIAAAPEMHEALLDFTYTYRRGLKVEQARAYKKAMGVLTKIEDKNGGKNDNIQWQGKGLLIPDSVTQSIN